MGDDACVRNVVLQQHIGREPIQSVANSGLVRNQVRQLGTDLVGQVNGNDRPSNMGRITAVTLKRSGSVEGVALRVGHLETNVKLPRDVHPREICVDCGTLHKRGCGSIHRQEGAPHHVPFFVEGSEDHKILGWGTEGDRDVGEGCHALAVGLGEAVGHEPEVGGGAGCKGCETDLAQHELLQALDAVAVRIAFFRGDVHLDG